LLLTALCLSVKHGSGECTFDLEEDQVGNSAAKLTELREQFLVDENVKPERLSRWIEKLLPHATVSKQGQVDLKRDDLSAKLRLNLVVVSRMVASKLDESIGEEVTIEEISQFAGLPQNQARARAKDSMEDGLVERTGRGSYRAKPHKIEAFLDELSQELGGR
jgi:hypothetical protein